MTGNIHSLESFGAADGPGVRFVVFMHGCNFRCAYCHNPDTWAEGEPPLVMTPEAVLERALRYRDYWGTDGGVTLSGGEPMLQARFAAEFFELAHAQGVSTCLDTAAGPFRRDDGDIVRLLSLTDTVLLDIKAFDADLHRRVTGAGNAAVLDCARYLAEKGVKAWIRRVLVPGLTDGEDDLRRTGEFIRSLGNVVKTEVLAYHGLGSEKWRKLAMEYPLENVQPPDDAALARARRILGC